jgi:hypothetical protein
MLFFYLLALWSISFAIGFLAQFCVHFLCPFVLHTSNNPAYLNYRILITLQGYAICKPRILCLGSYPFIFNIILSKYVPRLRVFDDVTLIQLLCFWALSEDQHAYEEGHNICWNCAKFLQIEPNIIHKKYKESAHMSLIDHPISQPRLDISASGLPLPQQK